MWNTDIDALRQTKQPVLCKIRDKPIPVMARVDPDGDMEILLDQDAYGWYFEANDVEWWIDVSESSTKSYSDKQRLDYLDTLCSPVTGNQSYGDPYGEHVANNWTVEWAATNVREALDKLIKLQDESDAANRKSTTQMST